jgi:hypothetical protein
MDTRPEESELYGRRERERIGMLPQQKPVFPWAGGTHSLRKLGPTVGRHRSTTSAQKQTTKLDAESLPFFLSLLPGSRSSTSRHSHARSLPALSCASQPLLRHLSATLYSSPLVSPSPRPPRRQHGIRSSKNIPCGCTGRPREQFFDSHREPREGSKKSNT